MADFAQRRASGRAARKLAPRRSHALWNPPLNRPDPVALLEEQGLSRVPELVPIRYGRMMVSPLTFYRGAALMMATDLAGTPSSGLVAQICGDAHLSNFGVFGTPERNMVFDLNDFDETLPGPWEWDLKRLAASFEVTGRQRKFSAADRRASTLSVTRGYRQQMRRASKALVLDAWYDQLDADGLVDWVQTERAAKRAGAKQVKRTTEVLTKARTKDSMNAFRKLVGLVDGQLRILSDPPLIEPIEDLLPDPKERSAFEHEIQSLLASYQTTLLFPHHPFAEFTLVHSARKVVGVGSVGTRAWILLLTGRDHDDPLFLQVKEAQASVLERFLGSSDYANHGQRVVLGQRLMQAASDIFLGWQRVDGVDGVVRDYYVRQLRDWKGSADVDAIKPAGAKLYAQLCGEALARAHARSGDRVAIASYIGTSDRLDRAIADFASAYADQNEHDYAAFTEAVSAGRLHAAPGL